MSRSVQEEILSVLWFILALLLWQCGYKILSILALIHAIQCTICSLVFAAISAREIYLKLKTAKENNA